MALTIKEASKQNYDCTTQNPSIEILTFGVLQRIADSLEILTVKYKEMETTLKQKEETIEYLRGWANNTTQRLQKAEKSNAALRGHLKRIKNGPKKTNL